MRVWLQYAHTKLRVEDAAVRGQDHRMSVPIRTQATDNQITAYCNCCSDAAEIQQQQSDCCTRENLNTVDTSWQHVLVATQICPEPAAQCEYGRITFETICA
eukprot:COSAG02_NODE_1178_length_14042_cov_11.526674_1_plen_102_part_00